MLLATQREIFKYIVLELRTFVLKSRVRTFWYQCCQEKSLVEFIKQLFDK